MSFEAEESEGNLKKSDARRMWTVGVFCFLLAPEWARGTGDIRAISLACLVVYGRIGGLSYCMNSLSRV